MFTTTFLVAAALLAACSEKSQSLADYLAAICAARFRGTSSAEMPFLTDNVAAISKMMVDMGINPSGDVDRDFVEMMGRTTRAPSTWHRLSCATATTNSRRMAQEIIVTQQQEIAAMRLAVGEALPPAAPALDQIPAAETTDSKSNRSTHLVKER